MKKYILIILFWTMLISMHAQTQQFTVTAKTLNMRSGIGTNNPVVKKLSQGDIVNLVNKSNQLWWQIEAEGELGYVFAKYLMEDLSGWEKTNYSSGTAPSCENINPKYDRKIDNLLRVNVGSGTDVVIKLMKIESYKNECIRIVYIRSGDVYDIKNIPEGQYFLKIAYGKDYRKKKIDGKCYVKFMKHALYEKGTEIFDFHLVKKPNTKVGNSIYENWEIPSFELSLDVIETIGISQSFNSSGISEAEFND